MSAIPGPGELLAATPGPGDLLAAIAARARCSQERVARELASAGVGLEPPLPAKRSLLVRRLYVAGVKAGAEKGSNGPFERDIELGPGAWAITSAINNAGKSSLLWALTWPLRGAPDDTYQRSDTSRWFRYLRADADVAGVPMSFRIRLDGGILQQGTLLTGETAADLAALRGQDEHGRGVRAVASATTAQAYADTVGRLMLERLGLPALQLFTTVPGSAPAGDDGERDGAAQLHGWPTYFSVIALASASDSVLFGKAAVGNLPTRYMQVFLDVPFVAGAMAADVQAKLSRQEARHAARRAGADAAARAARWGNLEGDLAAAERELAALRAARPDLPGRARAVQDATIDLLAAQARDARAQENAGRARQARLRDGRDLRRATESAAARAMLAALDPHACPRCQADIDDARRRHEDQHHQCAVCSSPLPTPSDGDEESREALVAGLRARLAASTAAERAAASEAGQAAADLARARDAAEAATAAARREQGDADYLATLQAAETRVATLHGALSIVRQLGQEDDAADDEPERILAAATEVLKKVAADATRELLGELNAEVLTVARQLGVANLKSVNLDLSGRVGTRLSDNPAATSFARLSPGSRLRLRIAIVASLIRVGRRHGIRSHPGLLVIDSPADTELSSSDTRALLTELHALGDTDDLQVIIATAAPEARDALPPDRIIDSPGGQHVF